MALLEIREYGKDDVLRKRWIRGQNNMVLNDVHGIDKFYIPAIDYIFMDRDIQDLPPIRFNKNFLLMDNSTLVYDDTIGEDVLVTSSIPVPIIKVPKDMFTIAADRRFCNFLKPNLENKFPRGNKTILPDTHGNIKYYIGAYDYSVLGDFNSDLPQIRFNSNFAISEEGELIGIVKVPEKIFNVARYFRTMKVTQGYFTRRNEIGVKLLWQYYHTMPELFDFDKIS